MVTKAERKALEKAGWISTGDVAHRLAREIRVNAGTWSMRVPKILNDLLDAKGRAYEAEHVKKLGTYTFVDETCYGDIKAEIQRLRKK